MASRRPSALHNANKLKLGLFSLNADGGIAITKVPERWRADWQDIAEVAKLVDHAVSSSSCRSRAGRALAARWTCARFASRHSHSQPRSAR